MSDGTTILHRRDEKRGGLGLQTACRRHTARLHTITQPRASLFELFDDLMIMSKGRLVYGGETQAAFDVFAGVGIECPSRVSRLTAVCCGKALALPSSPQAQVAPVFAVDQPRRFFY
jgi:hypothetical protein